MAKTIEVCAELGTVSHGTLRQSDLLVALAGELETLATANDHLDDYIGLITWAINLSYGEPSDDGAYVLDELFGVLNEYAPEGAYFGAHEGDGSDFGFWQSEGI